MKAVCNGDAPIPKATDPVFDATPTRPPFSPETAPIKRNEPDDQKPPIPPCRRLRRSGATRASAR